MKQVFHDFISLLFPPACLGCGKSLYADESYLCTFCWYKLPITNFHLHPMENAAAKHFWGRIGAIHAAAYLYLSPSSTVERLLYRLKYGHRPELGTVLGERYGRLLLDSDFAKVEAIMPVPLHGKKKRKRGYNQSAYFAYGLSNVWGVEVLEDNLVRSHFTASQTDKKRLERYENVKEAFALLRPQALEGKHLLLVDDVLTTGATLEVCAEQLLKIEGVRVSILTIAIAR